jgi:HEAT repeat protein
MGIAVFLAALLGSLVWASLPSRQRTPQQLVEGLSGRDAVNCASQLRQNEDEAVTQAIIEGTRSPKARVRAQCARLLGQRQDVDLVSALTPLLSDQEPVVSTQAARALVPLLDDDELLQLLHNPQLPPASQLAVANVLLGNAGMLANPGFVDWLLDRSHSAELRQGAYFALRAHHSSCYGQRKSEQEHLAEVLAARQRIAKQARQDAFDPACDESVRCAAMPLYAAMTGSSAYADVLPFLKANSEALREACLVSLAASKDPRALELFFKIARDEHQAESVRAQALGGLRGLVAEGTKDPRIFELFCTYAVDSRQPSKVRAVAAGSLRAYRLTPGALEVARRALHDKDPLVRQKAAQSVGGLGDNNAKIGDANYLEPGLIELKLTRACESDRCTQSAMDQAICNLERRIADRGK